MLAPTVENIFFLAYNGQKILELLYKRTSDLLIFTEYID